MNTSELVKLEGEITSQEFVTALQQQVSGRFNMNMAIQCAFAVEAIKSNKALQSCTPESIKDSIKQITMFGLSLNPKLSQAALIPRKGVCVLDPQYQGLITKLKEYKAAKEVFANVIYEGDDFEYDFTINKVVKYTPYHIRKNPDGSKVERGEEVGVYACAYRFDDYYQYVYMPIDRVNQIMEGTEAYKAAMAKKKKGEYYSTIWESENRGEMIKKTAIRYLWKMMPKSEDFSAIADIMDLHDNAHSMTDKSYSENGNEFVPKADSSRVTNHTDGKIKPVQTKGKVDDAELVYEPIDESAVELLTQAFKEGYSIEPNQKRTLPQYKEMMSLMAEKGFHEELLTKAYGDGSPKVKTLKDFMYIAPVESIEKFLKSAIEVNNAELKSQEGK